MDIVRYTSYFHDGEVLGIFHNHNDIEMLLKSAEVDPDIISNITLSRDHRIKGKLHLEGVKLILNNGNNFEEKIQMVLPFNDLLHLKIVKNIVFCEIGWRGQSANEADFSDFEINATRVWWENIPDL